MSQGELRQQVGRPVVQIGGLGGRVDIHPVRFTTGLPGDAPMSDTPIGIPVLNEMY